MPTLTRPDGTKVESEHLTVEFPDGTKVTASGQDFDVEQDDRSVSIPCTAKIIAEILASGRRLDEAAYAVLSSPDGQELVRVAIEFCLQLRGGDYAMRLEGQLVVG